MDKAQINGIELEYDVEGSGEPVLLISTGPIADSFHPLQHDEALARRYRLIAYRQRGQAGSRQSPGADLVSFEQHASDAAALLRHLDVARAHVAGHSTGAAIALQLAADQPNAVHSLILLEPPLASAPSAGAFFERAGPALAAYSAGNTRAAIATFLSIVSGLDWQTARIAIDRQVPSGVAQAHADADNFFSSYLPALNRWQFGPTRAAAIAQPVLSVLGTRTEQWFVDGHELLRQWFPHLDECRVDGVGHLLHIQRPEQVLSGVGAWLARHPLRAA